MLNDLDYVFAHIVDDPVSDEAKIAFSRVISHCELYGDDVQKRVLKKYVFFGKMVLHREQPVKPFFYTKFAQASMTLSRAFSKEAA